METDIKEYVMPLLRWWWLILLATAVAGGSSYLAVRQQPDVYSSSTSLMIGSGIENPNPSNNDLFITQQLAGTYVDLANRDSVRRSAIDAVGLSYMPEIYVRQFNDTNVIDIVVADTNPEVAQAVAASLANQLVTLSPTAENEDGVANQLLSNYETQIEQLQEEIGAKELEIGELISASEIEQAQADLNALKSNLREVTNIYANLRSSTVRGATNTVRILEEAYLPVYPQSNGSLTTVATAAAIGFVLAAAAAYVLEYIDDTLKTPEKVTKVTGVPTLAGIAEIKEDSKLITVNEPRSPTSEAFRIVRTAVQFSPVEENGGILLVTSSVPEEGKSTVAANMAVVMAQAGHKVLLIDADLRRPSQHKVFNVPNARGLTNVLLDYDDNEPIATLVDDAAYVTRIDGLQVLTCGPIPPNPSELLGSTKMRAILQKLEQEYDYVVLDSPPILSVTDGIVLSARAGGVLFVVKAGKSRRKFVAESIKRLHEVDAKLIGSVLNVLRKRSEGWGQYYYYRDPYSYAPTEETVEPEGMLETTGKLVKPAVDRG